MCEPEPGTVWRHHSGLLTDVLCVALHHDSGQRVVVHRWRESGRCSALPLAAWWLWVTRQLPDGTTERVRRFEPHGEGEG